MMTISPSNSELSSSNVTAPFYDENHFVLTRIIPNVVVCCLLALSLWVTISLVHFGIKTGKWRRLHTRSQLDKLNVGIIYTSITFCGVMVLFYDLVGLVYMNTGFAEEGRNLDDYCDSMSDLAYTAYALVLFSTSIFSWLRQRVFFRNRLLNVNYNKFVRFCSSSSLLLILGLGLAVLAMNLYPNDHESTPDGCVYNPVNKQSRIGYWILIIVVIVLYQGMFWGLFVYALRTTRAPAKNESPHIESTVEPVQSSCDTASSQRLRYGSSSTRSDFSTSPIIIEQTETVSMQQSFQKTTKAASVSSSCSEEIRSIMIKTFAAAVITILLDIFELVILNYISKPNEHRRFSVMLASFNLFLHLFLIVLSFAQYKLILSFTLYKKMLM